MDEFAFHDIPDSISYILDTTQQESLSYIGFSQGTAQAFATLAIHPKLNNQVNVFIALAPAMAPAGLSNGVVDSLVKASPSVLFLLFGRKSILSSATMWETLLYPPIFTKFIDISLSFLFNWQAKNISTSQKLAAYPHLYSFTSTKMVVHWFQIIRNKCFQMYDDDVHQPMSVSKMSKYSKVARYPTRNIKTPVVLVYGGSDSLVDIKIMLKELPSQTVATEIPHYEHLDFLWARDVDAQVFQHVFDALDSFTDAAHSKEEYAKYHIVRQESLIGSGYTYGHSQRGSESESSTLAASTNGMNTVPATPHRAREYLHASPKNVKAIDERSTPLSPPKVARTARPTEDKTQDAGTDSSYAPRRERKRKIRRENPAPSNISTDNTQVNLPQESPLQERLPEETLLEGAVLQDQAPQDKAFLDSVSQDQKSEETEILPTPVGTVEEGTHDTPTGPKKRKKKPAKKPWEKKRESQGDTSGILGA